VRLALITSPVVGIGHGALSHIIKDQHVPQTEESALKKAGTIELRRRRIKTRAENLTGWNEQKSKSSAKGF